MHGRVKQFDQQSFEDKLDALVRWVYRDFNEDHAEGKALDKLNPTLRFFVGMFRLTQMRPWQYVSYLMEIAADLPFQLTNFGADEL